jgi:hypothetical protein
MNAAPYDDLRGGPRARGLEAALECVVGCAALGGGLTLILAPRGSAMAPLSVLSGSGFDTFLVPGLLLALVVGGLNLTAAVLTFLKNPLASPASFVAGGALVIFVVTELLLLRERSFLQWTFLALGVTIAALSLPTPRLRDRGV